MNDKNYIEAIEKCIVSLKLTGRKPKISELMLLEVAIESLKRKDFLLYLQKAEIEMLKEKLKRQKVIATNFGLSYTQAQSEAIKNFLNQLKIHAYYPERSSSSVINQRVVDEDDIDMVAKRFIGGVK